MKVLLVGGAGRIGSVVLPVLLSRQHEVTVIDIKSGKDINSVVDVEHHDVIIHLAGLPSVALCESSPESAHGYNVLTTESVLMLAKKLHCPVIFTSSAAVYSSIESSMISETSSTNPISVYGKTKLEAEKLIRDSGVTHTILRLFNVLTLEEDSDGSLTSKIIYSSHHDCVINVFGDGEAVRDYVSVDTVALIISSLAEDVSLIKNDTYNIGSGYGVTVNSVVKEMSKALAVKLDVRYSSQREHDIEHSVSNNSKIKKLLPSVEIRGFYEDLYLLTVIQ